MRVPGRRRRLAVDAQITFACGIRPRHGACRRDVLRLPLRIFQISAAARPVAATLTCAAAATRNDDG
jgi:hypothetical protein